MIKKRFFGFKIRLATTGVSDSGECEHNLDYGGTFISLEEVFSPCACIFA